MRLFRSHRDARQAAGRTTGVFFLSMFALTVAYGAAVLAAYLFGRF